MRFSLCVIFNARSRCAYCLVGASCRGAIIKLSPLWGKIILWLQQLSIMQQMRRRGFKTALILFDIYLWVPRLRYWLIILLTRFVHWQPSNQLSGLFGKIFFFVPSLFKLVLISALVQAWNLSSLYKCLRWTR